MVFKSIIISSNNSQIPVGLFGSYIIRIMGIDLALTAADNTESVLVNLNVAEINTLNQANTMSFIHSPIISASSHLFNNPPDIRCNMNGFLNVVLTSNGVDGAFAPAAIPLANMGYAVLYLDCTEANF